ncbi:MAG: AAA family ATPase [Raoultibacter sp.]
MLQRKALKAFDQWKKVHRGQAMLVTGARQVGKTYLIEQFARENYQHVVKFDLIDQVDVREAMGAARSSQELFMVLSAFAGSDMVVGETVIFIDEVQQCEEALTLIKYLVQREGFDYILSGSLLGVELEDMRSAPVGYVHIVDMYPLDFEEFCWANGVGVDAWSEAEAAFAEQRPVFEAVHRRLLTLFHWYLVVGGMPQAVVEFISSHNIAFVQALQSDILRLYRHDISKYVKKNERLSIKEIFDQMPSQLDSQSKRFNFSSVAAKGDYERYKESFLWLVDAGVALPVRNVTEPKRPLKLVEDRTFFKLFMNDVGLLSAACGIGSARSILADDVNVNYGSIYENAVAQELHAHGKGLRFFRNRKAGELDFVIEQEGRVLPVEVKSGKSYKRHSALTNVLSTVNYGIDKAVVLCESNVCREGAIAYCPIYMVAFL